MINIDRRRQAAIALALWAAVCCAAPFLVSPLGARPLHENEISVRLQYEELRQRSYLFAAQDAQLRSYGYLPGSVSGDQSYSTPLAFGYGLSDQFELGFKAKTYTLENPRRTVALSSFYPAASLGYGRIETREFELYGAYHWQLSDALYLSAAVGPIFRRIDSHAAASFESSFSEEQTRAFGAVAAISLEVQPSPLFYLRATGRWYRASGLWRYNNSFASGNYAATSYSGEGDRARIIGTSLGAEIGIQASDNITFFIAQTYSNQSFQVNHFNVVSFPGSTGVPDSARIALGRVGVQQDDLRETGLGVEFRF